MFVNTVTYVRKPQRYRGTTAKRQPNGRRSPLLVRRGGCGIKKISAKPTLVPQTGWSLTTHIPARATTPSAPIRRLRGNFLNVASTPPHEEGIMPAQNFSKTFCGSHVTIIANRNTQCRSGNV
jgi:hypothetical protein